MKRLILFSIAVILGFALAFCPLAAFPQASPYSNSVFKSQIFTAAGQTGATIQLNGLVVASTVGSSFASGTITVTGSALSSVTFGVQGSSDNGANYYALPISPIASPGSTSTTVTATANGLYQINLAGLTHIRFVTSGTFSATSVSLTLTASPNGQIAKAGGGGGASYPGVTSDGANGLAVAGNLAAASGSIAGSPICTSATGCGGGGGGSVSVSEVPVQTMCPGATQTDANTGIGGTDVGPCINSYLAAHVTPSVAVHVILDGPYKASGIYGPRAGNWGITGSGAGMAQTAITGCTIASNVIACTTKANQLRAGQGIIFDGFPTSTFLNEVPVTVSATGLSSTGFQASLTHANATVEAGHGEAIYGAGIFQIANTNNDIIHNGPATSTCVVDGSGNHWMDAGWITPGPAPSRGANLVFRDFFINGNRNNNTGAGSAFGYSRFASLYTTPYCYFSGINIDSIDHAEVSGVTFYQIPAYDVKIVNAGDFRIENNAMVNYGYAGTVIPDSEDGVHVSGPANDGLISRNYLRAANDEIAFNAPEGYVGEIKDMVASYNVYDGGATAGRIYTGSVAPPAGDALPGAHNILWDGNVGTVGQPGSTTAGTGWGFQIGLEEARGTLTANNISGIRYSNNVLASSTFLYTNDNMGTVTLDGNEWIGGNCVSGITAACGFVTGTTVPHTINSLTLQNNRITRNANGSAATSLVDMQSGGVDVSVGQLTIDGALVTDVGGTYSTISDLIKLTTGSRIGTLQTANVDFGHFAELMPAGAIGQVSTVIAADNQGVGQSGYTCWMRSPSGCPNGASNPTSGLSGLEFFASSPTNPGSGFGGTFGRSGSLSMQANAQGDSHYGAAFVLNGSTDGNPSATFYLADTTTAGQIDGTAAGHVPGTWCLGPACTLGTANPAGQSVYIPGTAKVGAALTAATLYAGDATSNHDTASRATFSSSLGHTIELQQTGTSSARTALVLSSNFGGTYTDTFEFGTDVATNGTKDYYIYNYGSGKVSLDIHPDDSVTFPFVTAPTGSCVNVGSWAFSQDGKGSFCKAGTWEVVFTAP